MKQAELDFVTEDYSALKEAMRVLKEADKEEKRTVTQIRTEILHTITTCRLCKTVTHQLFEIAVFSDGTKLKERDLPLDTLTDIKNREEYSTFVKTCWSCKGYLLSLDKSTLVSMYLALYDSLPTKQCVKNYNRRTTSYV